MATQSDKAKQAAATKALRQRQQELDDQALIESTRHKYYLFSLYGGYLQLSLLKSLVRPKPKHWKLQVGSLQPQVIVSSKLIVLVWNGPGASQKRAASPEVQLKEQAPKKTKGGRAKFVSE